MGLTAGGRAVSSVARVGTAATGPGTLVPPRIPLAPTVAAARPADATSAFTDHFPELLGAAIAILGLIGRASGIDLLTIAAGLSLLPLGLAAPRITFLAMCILIPQRELGVPAGPLGFHFMALMAAFGGIALRLPFERLPIRVGLGAAALVVFLALAAVTLPAALIDLPLDRTKFAISQLLQLTAGAALFCGVAYIAARRDVRPYVAAVLTSGALACLATVLSTLGGPLATIASEGFATGPATLQRATGVLANANYMGLLAATVGVGCVAVAVHRRGLVRLLYLIGAACAVGAIAVTFSRGAILAMAAGIVTLAFARSRALGLALCAGLALAAVIIYPLFLNARLTVSYGDANDPNATIGQNESDLTRRIVLQAGLDLFQSAPFTGVGFGQFQFLSPLHVSGSDVTYPHNAYLRILAEQGILGVTAFVALLGMALLRIRDGVAGTRSIALAMAACYLLGAATAEPFSELQTSGTTWVLIASVIGPGLRRRA